MLKCHVYSFVYFLPTLFAASGCGPVWFDYLLLLQGTDFGAQYMFVKITGGHTFLAANQKVLCQKMSEDVWSRAKCPLHFSKIFMVPDAHGTCCVPHGNFLLERHEEELNTSKTCLFRIRLQFAYIWTSLLPPHPHLPLSEKALPGKQGSPRLPPH